MSGANPFVVRVAQTHLAKARKYSDRIDGIIGPKTLNAVFAWLDGNWRSRAWSGRRCVVYAAQVACKEIGADPGPLDGFDGPRTIYACENYSILNKLSVEPEAEPERASEAGEKWKEGTLESSIATPAENHLGVFFGEVGRNQALVELPFEMRLDWSLSTKINRFSVHARLADEVHEIFRRITLAYTPEQIVELGIDRFGGCLNVRKKRGGNSWSVHAWGAAIDLWPSANQLKWRSNRAAFAKIAYRPLHEIFGAFGWYNLGVFRNYDWMHFQKCTVRPLDGAPFGEGFDKKFLNLI